MTRRIAYPITWLFLTCSSILGLLFIATWNYLR